MDSRLLEQQELEPEIGHREALERQGDGIEINRVDIEEVESKNKGEMDSPDIVPLADNSVLPTQAFLPDSNGSLIKRIFALPSKFAKKVEESLSFSIDLYIAEREGRLNKDSFDSESNEKDRRKFALDKEVLLDLKSKLLEGHIRQKKVDFMAGFGALGLGYLTYGALISGNALFLAPILAYEAIPGLGGSPALYSALYMIATFGIPETVRILRDGSDIGVRRALTGTWLRVAGALNEIGFLILPLLKDRDITVHSTRLLSITVLSRIKPITRSRNLVRGIMGKEPLPIYDNEMYN